MSLINEALKRARGEAQRQAEAERAGAPTPTWTPPPFSRRERSPVVASVFASLAVSAVVLGLGFFLLRGRTKVATTEASPVSAAPAQAPPPAPSTPSPVALELPAPPAASQARVEEAPAKRSPAPRRSVEAGNSAVGAPVAPAPASTPTARTAVKPAAHRPGEINGKSFVHQVTLPNGATIELGGIISGTTPLAMLNGHVIGIGEYVESCAVAKVEAQRVELHGADGVFWIQLQ